MNNVRTSGDTRTNLLICFRRRLVTMSWSICCCLPRSRGARVIVRSAVVDVVHVHKTVIDVLVNVLKRLLLRGLGFDWRLCGFGCRFGSFRCCLGSLHEPMSTNQLQIQRTQHSLISLIWEHSRQTHSPSLRRLGRSSRLLRSSSSKVVVAGVEQR